MYIYTYTHIHIYTYKHIFTYTYVHTQTHTHIYMYTHTCRGSCRFVSGGYRLGSAGLFVVVFLLGVEVFVVQDSRV